MRQIKFGMSNAFKLVIAGASLLAGSSAMAVQSWNMNISSGTSTGDLNTLCTSSATTSIATGACGAGLTVSGWSTGTGAVGTTTTTANFNAATVYDWGTAGLGVVASNESSGGTGPHATDNKYGTDAFLFSFSTATNLSGVKLGWNGTDSPASTKQDGSSCTAGSTGCVTYNDSDLSIFAWTGTGAPTASGTTQSTMTAASSGWKLVGNYLNVGATTTNSVTATSTIFSSYWLVSAYNSAYGGTADANVDAFKVLAISATNCASTQCATKVPEPGSIALLGAAFLGFVATRRRKSQAI